MITMIMARIGANLTQQQLADALGVHVQTYQRMEKHPEDISIKHANEFARIVGVPLKNINFLPIDSN